MATVTDVLRTSFEVIGIQAFQQAMNTAVNATEKLADAQKEQKKHGGQLKDLIGGLGVEHALLAGGIGAVAFGLKEAIDQFKEDEDAIFRTTVVLKNLGNSYPIEEALAFANAQEQLTGMAGDQILEVEALLKRFGAADKDIQGLTKTVEDFSAATGLSLEHAATAVGHALVGNTRILKNMGIEFKATGDRAKDLATVQEKLNALFGGAAEARLGTLTGQFDALKQAMSSFFSTVGDKISTVLIPAMQALTALLQELSNHPALANALFFGAAGAILTRSPQGAAIGAIGGLLLGLLPSRENPAQNIGNGQAQLATEGTLQKLLGETKGQTDAIIQKVLGGPGQVAGRAWTWRDQQIAWGV